MPEADALHPLAALARRHDPDRFLCALFAPAEARQAIFTLIAFNHELARAREVAREPMMVLIRLQWWRDTVEEAVAGRPARQHEVAAPLSAAIEAGRLDPAALLAMIEAREGDEPPEDRQALEERLLGTAGALAAETGRILDAGAGFAEALARAGAAYGLAGTLRSLPHLLAAGRRPLPGEILPANTPLSDPAAAGAIRALAGRGLGMLGEARRALSGLPRRSIAAALPAVLAGRDLRRLASPGWRWDAPPAPRGAGDRMAVAWAGLRGRL
ncbi:phytoene synthase [Roseomonas rosea]|uniref:Phytoene synthase n=1 Tax=Muricoccus roseus TaxID=198092 RepID=A0A1M6JM97_9PROT|nr:squalene/phytoene synthase family protein [Roseomonas rosea]SHJ47754.1 phytoene synthase [Roseomonas rosea]